MRLPLLLPIVTRSTGCSDLKRKFPRCLRKLLRYPGFPFSKAAFSLEERGILRSDIAAVKQMLDAGVVFRRPEKAGRARATPLCGVAPPPEEDSACCG